MAAVIIIIVDPVFKPGDVSLSLQTEFLDKIMTSLLPALLTLVVYKLIASKKMSVIQIIFGIIVLSIILSYFGILKA